MARTKQQQPESNPSLSIKGVTKSSVWDIQENDVIRMWEAACKDAEVKENVKHYVQIFKSAFFIVLTAGNRSESGLPAFLVPGYARLFLCAVYTVLREGRLNDFIRLSKTA